MICQPLAVLFIMPHSMKWIASLTLLFALAGGVLAAGTDDQYLDILGQILQADTLQGDGHLDAAAVKYRDAQEALEKLHADHPKFDEAIVGFRLEYLAGKLKQLGQYLPGSTNAPAAAPAILTPQQQLAALQGQISALTAANEQLRQKIKEALSVQPAAVAPGELAKAQEKNVALQKERDLLQVALEQEKAAKAAAADLSKVKPSPADELAALKTQSSKDAKAANSKIDDLERQLEETRKRLAGATAELDTLKSRPSADSFKELAAERDQLKKDLAAKSKELAEQEAHPQAAPAAPSQDAIKLKQVEQERDELAKQVAAVARLVPNPGAGEGATLSAENNGLRAQLAVLEAGAVPYTSEELAVLNAAAPAIAPAQIPEAGAETTHKPHSVRELPPGAVEVMIQAQRAAEEQHDYVQAEQKYLEVLAQDPDNVYVLVHLGLAQYGEGHLDDCEKNVHHALTLDPEDAGALYLLGILRYRQEKWDESLDALSRSASINPTNSSTQYSLGCVLAAKGLRSKAETAFRKALEIDPLYADAHYNLAFVYATEKPPAPALARWHYQRAVALGHAKSSDLEKLLGGGP
jgi:Flp pilus assembly protein TadD